MSWNTVINGHELIEVGNRRWCVTCTLFQQKGKSGEFPPLPAACRRTTPYARWLESGVGKNDEVSG